MGQQRNPGLCAADGRRRYFNISLAEPAFGFTNVLDGHPFAETPYYDSGSKSWIYGATYERRPNVAYNTAAVLFQNPK